MSGARIRTGAVLRAGWLAASLLACSSEPTALVLEVQSAVAPGQLETVNFHVEGPGLEAGGRDTEVPVVGAGARSFPLRLTLVHGGAAMGPFRARIEGRAQGELRARVVDPPALYFQAERTVTHHFVLQSPGAPAPTVPTSIDAGTTTPMPPPAEPAADAGPPPTPPPTPPPMPPPPDAAGPTCPSKCENCGDDKDCRKECKKLGCCTGKCEEGEGGGED